MTGTVLVTGAGGFIGSAVTRRLVHWMSTGTARFWDAQPLTQVCAVLRPGGSDRRLSDIKDYPHWRIERIDLVEEDLPALLKRYRPRAVLHLAFDASGFLPLSEDKWRRAHLNPLTAMLQELSGFGGCRFVHTSSCWVLAEGDRLSESARLDPKLEYAKTKARLDEALVELGVQTGVSWINLRLFNVFGQYESTTRLLPYLVTSLRNGTIAKVSHGGQIRDFNDVDDIAEAYLRALLAPDTACNAFYHIGSGVGTSVREFAAEVEREVGRAGFIRYSAAVTRDQQIACLVADPTRAIATLGWRPASNLRGKIARAVRWWLSRPADDRSATSP